MKKSFIFLLLLAITMFVVVNVNYSSSDSNMKRILQNVDALAENPESGGSSEVVGKCKDEKGECKASCPGSGCTMTYSGTSGKDCPLEFASGTCSKCGHKFGN